MVHRHPEAQRRRNRHSGPRTDTLRNLGGNQVIGGKGEVPSVLLARADREEGSVVTAEIRLQINPADLFPQHGHLNLPNLRDRTIYAIAQTREVDCGDCVDSFIWLVAQRPGPPAS